MPSPVGHALGGVAAGWMVESPPSLTRRRMQTTALLYAAAGMAPDLDLLVGWHRGPTHSVAAACLVGLAAYAITRNGRLGLALAASWATHPLLDWLGHDTTPPVGVMALWPFTREYYEAGVHLFSAISRRYWLPDFWTFNLRALARELLILAPVLAAVAFLRRPGQATSRES